MFDVSQSFFNHKQPAVVPSTAKVVFVADMYVEDYVGGAELTTQALIDSCPVEYVKLMSKDVTLKTLESGVDKFWIFGNFSLLDGNIIPAIVANMKYAVLEYDYKYCHFRSPEKHFAQTGMPCDCHNQMNGKLISAFYQGAVSLWWMSEKQKDRYHTLFPFLAERPNIVLSSVFSPETLGTIKMLREAANKFRGKEWIVLGSTSWVKGAEAAEAWCKANGKSYEVVWNIPYKDLLCRLASAEGFVYLPKGADTCPRMVIEAKLLGCKLQLNENVQHKDEEWFATSNLQDIEDYLYAAPKLFWEGIKRFEAQRPTISGYTTTYNCLDQGYPIDECITSMLAFCDEVCIVDGGSTDGTWQRLKKLADEEPKLKLKQVIRDWKDPRFAVFDGMQKAEARAMCTMQFCWQMDSDEIVHEDDAPKITDLAKQLPKGVDIVSLPVIEYWGGPSKVRADVLPWKWRLSRNLPHITHGIPASLRRFDENGKLYASEGTDGCDMIDATTGESLPHVTFMTSDVDAARRAGIAGNAQALAAYEQWFNQVVEALPGVFHYSWYDIARKIRLYQKYWTGHWNSLYNKNVSDTAENNMMFDMPWSQVTDDMIEARAKELGERLGGWIWHRKWDGKTLTPAIKCYRTQPKLMQ